MSSDKKLVIVKCPIDPTLEENPFKGWKRGHWHPKGSGDFVCDGGQFHQEWIVEKILSPKTPNIYWVRDKETNTSVIGKKFEIAEDDEEALHRRFKEWLFIQITYLVEYNCKFYHDWNNNEVWIVMPYYGKTLKQRIKDNGPFTNENKVKEIAWDLVDKLWIIHNSGFVYGDIKPSNVVKRELNKNEDEKEDLSEIIDGWKFIDFETIQKNNSRNGYIGTFGWTAPEIHPWPTFRNKYKYSSDIFSFGLLILYILCGEQPLEEDWEKRFKYFTDLGVEEDGEVSAQMNCNWKYHWYKNVILESENVIKNKLVKLYYDNKISLGLFELLHDGLLVYDPKKRWDCKKIYNCKWFQDLRDEKNSH